MKRIICILLAVSFLLGFSACGKTLPEETTSSKETGYVMRTQYSYPKDYNLNVIYSMENAVKDSNEYYEAISEAFPNRPVLAVICNSYFGEVYSTLLNDALNVWLEENGYNFAVMIYSFGINNLLQEGTFANKVKEFVEAGGKCDVIVTGANISSFGIVPSDTIWDYVDGGLISPLNTVAGTDFSEIEQAYGEVFVERNTFDGNVYGFSLSALDGTKNATYLAVSNECLHLVEDLSRDELVNAVLTDREFLEEVRETAGTEYAIGYDVSSGPTYALPALCLGNSYTSVNMLPLYIDRSSEDAKVIALWEAPEFINTISNLAQIERAGLSDYCSGGSTYYSAMIFTEGYTSTERAQEYFDLQTAAYDVPEYTLIPIGEISCSVGPECAMLLSSSASNPESAVEFITSALTDEGLGSALVNGVEGICYTMENGGYESISTFRDVWIYPNNIFRLDEAPSVNFLFGQYKEVQGENELELYENFCADISRNYEEATALVEWYGYYNEAGQTLYEIPKDMLDDPDIIPVETLIEDPVYPDIDSLKADIEAQLQEYLKAYN